MENQTIIEIADHDIVSSEPSQKRISDRVRKCTTRFEEDPYKYRPTMIQKESTQKTQESIDESIQG